MNNLKKKILPAILSGCLLLSNISSAEYLKTNNGSEIFGYNVSTLNQSSPKFLDNKEKQVLVYSNNSNQSLDEIVRNSYKQELINSIDSNFLDVYVNINQSDKNNLKIGYYNNGYGNLNSSEKQKIGYENSFFYENPNNTYLYLALPQGINLVDNLQKIFFKNVKTGEILSRNAISGDGTIAYKLASNINDRLNLKKEETSTEELKEDEESFSISNVVSFFKNNSLSSIAKKVQTKIEENFEYVDTSGAYIELLRKIPGKIGDAISTAITLTTGLDEIYQRQQVKKIIEEFGEDYLINRIKMYTLEDKNFLTNINIGREFDLEFNKSKNYNGKDGFLIIPNIYFENTNRNQYSQLKDIVFNLKFE